MIVLKMESES